MTALTWLPEDPDWRANLAAVQQSADRWAALRALASTRMDFLRTVQLDKRLRDLPQDAGPEPLRLALFASSTVEQLLPGLRVAAARRGIRLDIRLSDYGQYRQDLLGPQSTLADFRPQVALFAIDAREMVGTDFLSDGDARARVAARVESLRDLWKIARDRFGAQVIQQSLLPVFEPLMGGAEYRAEGSPLAMVAAANAALRAAATEARVDILAVDERAARDGLAAWYSHALWHRAKQEISPTAAPLYGELAMRIVAARRGLSAKCLVLDLDNTVWGGVIGDDGLDGIMIGQGSAGGEAFLDFQRYAKALAQRGIILAICSKNDEANAAEPFEKHPDMLLRRADFAAFRANWDDKATNLRRIAADLNIGLDALVFADDNPFERNIIRRELPMVAVPELPEDPGLYAAMIADAGYFEALEITEEDRARSGSYQARRAMAEAQVESSDVAGYLATLGMALRWGHFDPISLKRATQLINKTNQFNLTTRRYTESESAAIVDDPDAFGLHLRLVDRYADHGIIAVVIGRGVRSGRVEIDSWLMSCRVLGRGVEQATLAAIRTAAIERGATALIGRYVPTAKNGMVRDHYRQLGFAELSAEADGTTLWQLDLAKPGVSAEHIDLQEIR